MDYKLKRKMQSYETSRKQQENLGNPGFDGEFFDAKPKV
jgi:hypothetical protein